MFAFSENQCSSHNHAAFAQGTLPQTWFEENDSDVPALALSAGDHFLRDRINKILRVEAERPKGPHHVVQALQQTQPHMLACGPNTTGVLRVRCHFQLYSDHLLGGSLQVSGCSTLLRTTASKRSRECASHSRPLHRSYRT